MNNVYAICGEADIPRVLLAPTVRRPLDTSRLPDDIPNADWGYWSALSDPYLYECLDCGAECCNPSAGDFRNYCPECGTEQ